MKPQLFIASLLVCLATSVAAASESNPLTIIPAPQQVTMGEGAFQLNAQTRIYCDPAAGNAEAALVSRLRRATGFPLPTSPGSPDAKKDSNYIWLMKGEAKGDLGPESYQLRVEPRSIAIRAPADAGLFYGVQTLLQLFPPQVFSRQPVKDVAWKAPCVLITDWPQFRWRGFMLDVSRHFFNQTEVEEVLDAMAMQKLNVFHWHLTDDQGWRIEIKKYPKLTSVGAWRSGIGFGLQHSNSTAYGPDGRYGGFYTRDQIREVVAYAAARHITVVPEIEMPGHASAALAAYPEFSCTPDKETAIPMIGGVFHGIYDVSNEKTYEFLQNVLLEVFELFPGRYVHIGGDEVPGETWEKSAACQALMKREGLKDTEALQNWFTRRIEKFVSAHDRTMIGWSEILKGGLSGDAAVMDWIGGATEASTSGHDVVMSPTRYCYFDYYQSTNHATEPHSIGGFVPLELVYSFDPIPTNLPAQYARHILGPQANLWTEYIPNLKHVEYMTFPRLTALAEIGWSPKSARNFDDFSRRLETEFKRFDLMGINYRPLTK